MRNKFLFTAVILALAGVFAAGMLLHETPAIGQETAKYWGKRCNKDDSSYCEIFQTVTIKKNNQKLLEFALGYPKDQKGAQGVLVLPLGFIMTDGIGLQVDEGQVSKAMVRFCNTSGCYVYMNLPETFIETMKTGKQMSVFFLDGTGKKIRLQMPLEGFDTMLKQIKS